WTRNGRPTLHLKVKVCADSMGLLVAGITLESSGIGAGSYGRRREPGGQVVGALLDGSQPVAKISEPGVHVTAQLGIVGLGLVTHLVNALAESGLGRVDFSVDFSADRVDFGVDLA